MPPQQRDVRIWLLGELRVRRPDGSDVDYREWRTGKTADLLRLLAISHGRPVSIATVINRLWPGVRLDRARASVRTAASQIRRTTRVNCVVRQNGGLVLTGAWVDLVQFREAAHRAQQAARQADHPRTIGLAEIAERLYSGDFHAYDDQSAWARAQREDLRQLRRDVLCKAADAAVAIEAYDAAVDFAEHAVRIEPISEAAYRALMLAYASMGETASALRAFETCRVRLADELGVDPSAKTRAVHVRVLRGDLVG